MRNHYEVLGVPTDASTEQVKAAYRRLAKVVHPDVTGADTGLFALVTDAYDVLSDPRGRASYDAELARPGGTHLDHPDPASAAPANASSWADSPPSPAAATDPPPAREPIPHFALMLFGGLIVIVLGVIFDASTWYDRVLFWVHDGSAMLGGTLYERSHQEQPGALSWVFLAVIMVLPVLVVFVATYLWRVARNGGVSSLGAAVAGLVALLVFVTVSPVAFVSTGWVGIPVAWVVFALGWTYGPRVGRAVLPSRGRAHDASAETLATR